MQAIVRSLRLIKPEHLDLGMQVMLLRESYELGQLIA